MDQHGQDKPRRTAYHSRIAALAQPKHKLSIIHDINILTRRSQVSHIPPEQQQNIEAAPFETAPTEAELESLVSVAHRRSHSDRNEDYLRNNMGTVKQKIRNKLLRQKVDFADNTPCREEKGSPQRERIDRYNHDFEESLIRKKISSKCHTLPEERSSEPEERPLGGQRKRTWEETHGQLGCGQGRLIIVSRMNPQHALTTFRNIVIETARKSLSKSEEAEFLLRKYVNRHFRQGVRSFQQRPSKEAERETALKVSPVGCLRDRANQTARKRELKQLRKESIGLPLLLEGECGQDFSLQEKFNSKKMAAFLNAEPTRKKVVFSRRNMHH